MKSKVQLILYINVNSSFFIFVPKKYEVSGGWMTLHNDKFRCMCGSFSVIRVAKSRRYGLGST
jgi:hypothetical protein